MPQSAKQGMIKSCEDEAYCIFFCLNHAKEFSTTGNNADFFLFTNQPKTHSSRLNSISHFHLIARILVHSFSWIKRSNELDG